MISSIFSLKQNAQITLFRDKPQLKIIKFQWEEEIIFSCYLEGHRCESVMPLFKWRLPWNYVYRAENFRMRYRLSWLLNLSIHYPMDSGHNFDFFLNSCFLDSREKSKTGFKIREFLPILHINLKWRTKCLIYRLHIRDSDWLNFIHFSGYKYKIKLVSILWKREDQALISISTILKFSAQLFRSNIFGKASGTQRICTLCKIYSCNKVSMWVCEIAWKPSYAFTFSVKVNPHHIPQSKSKVNRSKDFEGYDQTYKQTNRDYYFIYKTHL